MKTDPILSITPGSLKVAFRRQGDRFAHRLMLADTLLAGSVEGSDQDPWPPSPPLQQLSIEDLGHGPAALLVGMAGRSHWSLSVESRDGCAVFDAACRVRGADGRLLTTYRVGPDTEVAQQEDHSMMLESSAGAWTIELDRSLPLAMSELHWDDRSRELRVFVPGDLREETVRWKYLIRAEI